MSIPSPKHAREPEHWLEDMYWHRQMFKQSHFRWAPEDPLHIALRYVRGRCSFESPAELHLLDRQQMELRGWIWQVQDAMAVFLPVARNVHKDRGEWDKALELIGMSDMDAEITIRSADTHEPLENRDVRRALRGYPYPNPLTKVWELRQVHGMYQAADDFLEDTLCDLVLELQARHGWTNLAALTSDPNAQQLQWRVERQREARGEPGDVRRRAEQRY